MVNMYSQWPCCPFRQLTAPLGTFNYTVVPGDTLNGIARKFNTTPEILVKFNYIPNPNLIYPGRILIIPQSPPEAIIYTVKPVDTLSSIARNLNAQVSNIIMFNYLTNPDLIYPGQKLVVAVSLR